MASRDGSRSAFTLIELLVTVTIIAVLVALVLPVIGVVRDQARTISCQSNQRGLGVAILAWARDNNGRLPYGQGAPAGMAYNWVQAAQQMDPKTIVTCPGARIRSGTRHYTANMQPLTDRYFGWGPAKPTRTQVRIAELRSELVMLFDGGQVAGGDAWPMSENMGFTFYYSDNPYLSPSIQNEAPVPAATSGTFRIDNRHASFKRANYLYADGHSRSTSMESLTCGDFRILSNGRKYW